MRIKLMCLFGFDCGGWMRSVAENTHSEGNDCSSDFSVQFALLSKHDIVGQ